MTSTQTIATEVQVRASPGLPSPALGRFGGASHRAGSGCQRAETCGR